MSKTGKHNDHSENEHDPMPNPEFRGYYGIGGFFIFGELIIIWGCFYIPNPDNFWIALITGTVSFMVLMAMIVQTEISKRQWEVMQAGLEQTERSMQNAQAAYLMETNLIFGEYKVGKSVVAGLEFSNTGQTPAYDVRIYAHLTYEQTPFRFTHERAKDMSDMLYQVHPCIIGPNGGLNSQMITLKELELTPKMLRRERTQPLHVWGLITYKDIFGRERWSEFCYRKLLPGIEGVGNKIQFTMTELHNEADRPKTTKNPN